MPSISFFKYILYQRFIAFMYGSIVLIIVQIFGQLFNVLDNCVNIYNNSIEFLRNGEKLMEVKKIVSKQFISVNRTNTIADVMKQFIKFHHDIACVIEKDKLIGIVTKYSLYRLLLKTNNIYEKIENAIIANPVTLHENDSVYQSKDKLIKMNIAHAIVLNDDEEVVGILSNANISQGLIKELKHIMKQLNNLMNNLQSIIISVDLNLNITTLNHSAKKLLHEHGFSSTYEHIGYLFPELTNHIIEVIESQQINDYQSIELFGKKYICSFIPIQAWNIVTGVMVVLDDVSKYERIAQELESTKQIEQMLDSALEVAYDGVVITDPDGNIVKVNNGFYELIQLPVDENIIGKPLKSIVKEIPLERTIEQHEDIKGAYIEINGYKTVVTQASIYRNQKRIGIIVKVLFQQLELWKELFDHMNQLESEISYYRKKLQEISEKESHFNHIVSTSKVMGNLKQDALIAAKGFSNVLITGESGTGKDLFAQGIHRASGRKGNFIKINCAAIPGDLLESELFGYEDGAFTGAKKGGKPGKFELAHNGTLFLDEIGDMPISLQVKLLRVLQDQKFERVGGVETKYVDVRIITATNRDLLSMIREGKFREDLYYRINVIHLHLPPLRERKEDISFLTTYFINSFNQKMNKNIRGIEPKALNKLVEYEWPGNIRELQNILERAFHYCNSKWIRESDIVIQPSIQTKTMKEEEFIINKIQPLFDHNYSSSPIHSKQVLQSTEKDLIIRALQSTNGNRTDAAKLLNISRSTLYYKIKKYDIKEVNNFS